LAKGKHGVRGSVRPLEPLAPPIADHRSDGASVVLGILRILFP
jgi:hypothetical protein